MTREEIRPDFVVDVTPTTCADLVVPDGFEWFKGGAVKMTERTPAEFQLMEAIHERIQPVLLREHNAFATMNASLRCFPHDKNIVRKPAISIFGNVPQVSSTPDSFVTVAPHIVIEIVSRKEKALAHNARLADYEKAGIQRVWSICPSISQAIVWRLDGTGNVKRPYESLSGEDVLPGFTLPLAEILPKVK